MRHSQEESVKLFFKKPVIFASQIQLRSLGVNLLVQCILISKKLLMMLLSKSLLVLKEHSLIKRETGRVCEKHKIMNDLKKVNRA